ncbi:thiopeptide-type bacteriocin biosynthesis protein [Micromonospora sp. M12]
MFPLLTTRSVRRPAWPRGVRRPATGRHLPGGEWLYALVYCSGERQDELLRAVPALAAGLDVDRWFFLRYGDPDPHLRLRFHGAPAVLTTGCCPGSRSGWLGCATPAWRDAWCWTPTTPSWNGTADRRRSRRPNVCSTSTASP